MALAAVLAAGSAAQAAEDWMTGEQVEAAAQELIDSMAEAGFRQISPPEKVLESAHQMIAAMRAEIEKRGESGLAELAPSFDGVELPGSGSPLLDRLGSFNLCFVALSIRIQDPAIREDDKARLSATLGASATNLAARYFSHLYLAAGGAANALPAYTADEGRKAVFQGLFRDPEQRAAVLAGCQPAVRELVGSTLRTLMEQALFE